MKNQKQVNQLVEEMLKLDWKGLSLVVDNLNGLLEGNGVPNPIKPRHQLQLGLIFGQMARLHALVGR